MASGNKELNFKLYLINLNLATCGWDYYIGQRNSKELEGSICTLNSDSNSKKSCRQAYT